MTTRVEELKAKQAKELVEAEAAERLEALIPPGGRIYMNRLYGAVAWLTYESRYGQPPVTWAMAAELAEKLPPVSLTYTKGTFTAIMVRSYVEAMSEDEKAQWKQETDVSPVLLQIGGSEDVEVQWYTDLADVGIVRVTVRTGRYLPPGIGSYNPKRKVIPGEVVYGSASFSPASGLHTIFDGPTPIAQLESPIRWASGSANYANRMTCYFVDLGADQNPAHTGLMIVRQLAALAGGK